MLTMFRKEILKTSLRTLAMQPSRAHSSEPHVYYRQLKEAVEGGNYNMTGEMISWKDLRDYLAQNKHLLRELKNSASNRRTLNYLEFFENEMASSQSLNPHPSRSCPGG